MKIKRKGNSKSDPNTLLAILNRTKHTISSHYYNHHAHEVIIADDRTTKILFKPTQTKILKCNVKIECFPRFFSTFSDLHKRKKRLSLQAEVHWRSKIYHLTVILRINCSYRIAFLHKIWPWTWYLLVKNKLGPVKKKKTIFCKKFKQQ